MTAALAQRTRYACRYPSCGERFDTEAGARGHVARVHSAAGRVALRVARSTGTEVGLYDGELSGMDTEGGRWQTVCEEHAWIISHLTLATARSFMAVPAEWCERCAGTDVES